MESYTIRLDPDEIEQLEREADERGFGNRTEYMRWIIRNRSAIEQTTVESLTARIEEMENQGERLDDLEERIEQLENE
jgi:polyhydroxyalkanoate synthesis regulator phasin